MDSDNWRVKREPSKEEDDGNVSGNNAPSTRRGPPQQSSFSGWGGVPSYRDRQPLYQGGSNPTRGRLVAPALRPTGPIANDPKADKAIEEGRRIYVGNLPYDAQIADIRALLIQATDSIQDISMSVDPMTGQNPSYCFVDFTSEAGADKALQQYNGMKFMGRPLKVNHAFRAGDGKGRYHLKRDLQQPTTDSTPTGEGDTSPYAFDRWRRLDSQYDPKEINASTISEERRLYVGGLPRFPNQATCNLKMRELFKGYNVEIVSKPISPHESVKNDPGNHYYCFVDLATTEEVGRAIEELDGIQMFNWNLRIQGSSWVSGKLRERQRVNIHGLPDVLGFDGEAELVRELKLLLQPYGDLEVVSKIFSRNKDEKTGLKSGCYCFVEFAEAHQADAAILKLDGTEFFGSKLSFWPSKNRRALEEHFSRA